MVCSLKNGDFSIARKSMLRYVPRSQKPNAQEEKIDTMNMSIVSLCTLSLFLSLVCFADGGGINDCQNAKPVFLSGNSWGSKNDELSVLALDSQSLEYRTYWKTTADGNWFITDVWPAPLGKDIALCMQKLGPYESVLILLNDQAVETMRQSEFGSSCAFSPDGTKLAYSRARIDEAERLNITGTWIYDIAAGTHTKISAGGERLCWAAFDGNLYILREALGQKVVRYVPQKDLVEETNHKDVIFSGDGKYYYAPTRGEGIEFCLYSSETDESIMNDLGALFCYNWETASLRWLANEWILLEGVSPGSIKWYIFNPYKKVMKRSPGPVAALSEDGKEVIHYSLGGAFARVSTDSLQTITLRVLRDEASSKPAFRENLPSEIMEAFKKELSIGVGDPYETGKRE